MSEPTGALDPAQAAGQLPGDGSGQQDQGGGEQPKYITLEEAQRLATEAEDRAYRRAQGLFDKGQSRVKERLDGLSKHLELMRSANIQVTPEQELALRQRAYEEAMQPEPAASAAPGAQPAPQAAVQNPPDPITGEAWRMQREAGIVLEDSDPEVGTLDQDHGPYAFLRSIEKAIDTKRQRLGQTAPGTNQNGVQSAAPARTPTNMGGGGVSTDPILQNYDPDDLIARGLGKK